MTMKRWIVTLTDVRGTLVNRENVLTSDGWDAIEQVVTMQHEEGSLPHRSFEARAYQAYWPGRVTMDFYVWNADGWITASGLLPARS